MMILSKLPLFELDSKVALTCANTFLDFSTVGVGVYKEKRLKTFKNIQSGTFLHIPIKRKHIENYPLTPNPFPLLIQPFKYSPKTFYPKDMTKDMSKRHDNKSLC